MRFDIITVHPDLLKSPFEHSILKRAAQKGLVEINLQFNIDGSKVKGVVALISSSFNAEDINIVEIMSSAPELLIFIRKADLIKALNVINKLESVFKANSK